jgi:hypothetical protein
MPTPEEIQRQVADTVAGQFQANLVAAEGCDVLVAGGGLNFGLRSVAEKIGARYVYAAFCAISLPSAHHAPPAFAGVPRGTGSNLEQWEQDAGMWNTRFLALINSSRAGLGLAEIVGAHGFPQVEAVLAHVIPQCGAHVIPHRSVGVSPLVRSSQNEGCSRPIEVTGAELGEENVQRGRRDRDLGPLACGPVAE